MAPPALNAIDADLAALEAKLRALEEDEDSYSDASEASSSASDDSRARKRAKKEAKSAKKDKKRAKKKHKKSTRDAEGDDEPMIIVGGEDLERIAPLPKSLLPEGNDYRGKGASFLGKRGTGASASAKANATSSAPESGSNPPSALPETELARRLAARAARPRCDACDMDFTSDAQYVEHCRGKKHAKAIRGPVDAAPRAPRAVKPPPGPHCALCRKIFTSDAQRVEHEGGKWHRQRVAGTLPPSNKPYA